MKYVLLDKERQVKQQAIQSLEEAISKDRTEGSSEEETLLDSDVRQAKKFVKRVLQKYSQQ